MVNRGFVCTVLEDSKVLALIQWDNDTWSPDEFLWATIQRLPGVPGSMRPSPKFDMTDMHAIARLVKWPWYKGVSMLKRCVYMGPETCSGCCSSTTSLPTSLTRTPLLSDVWRSILSIRPWQKYTNANYFVCSESF